MNWEEKLIEKEVWKQIEGYDEKYNYEVSNLGNVRTYCYYGKKLQEPMLLNQKDNGKGYLQVALYKNGKREQPLVHRLVAIAFIPNPLNKSDVNHINEFEKHNNRVENLEWMTREENINYGTHNERCCKHQPKSKKKNNGNSKPVIGTNIKTGEVLEFPSMSEVKRALNINVGHISECCKGSRKSTGGYKWMYKEEL